MTRFILVVAVVFVLTDQIGDLAAAADASPKKSTQQADQEQDEEIVYIPKDLDDCFAELKKTLSKEVIEKMKSGTEKQMIRYHHGLGTWLRNNWGLRKGSRLSKWFNEKGIRNPDDMSGIILNSFWRDLNNKPIELEKQVKHYQDYWKEAKKAKEVEEQREKKAIERLHEMVMNLSYNRTQCPRIAMPQRSEAELRARFLVRFREGVFIAVRTGDSENFNTTGYFLDIGRRTLHRIHVPEITDVKSAVVCGDTAYFCGTTGKQPILVSVADKGRTVIPLPIADCVPQLGIDDKTLLAVYTKSIHGLAGNRWSDVYRGTITLPRSGPPPRKVGDRIVFRDEGRWEDEKRLWWLELRPKTRLTSLVDDIGLVGPSGPRWENCFSYCTTSNGDFWATLGGVGTKKSVIKRSAVGKYSIAAINNSVAFDGSLLGETTDYGLSISTIYAANGTVLAVGDHGHYSIDDTAVRQLLQFDNTTQDIPIHGGSNVYHWSWAPSDMLVLGEDRYLISGTFGGIYLLCTDTTGLWGFGSLDEHEGDAINF
jgi:hypothetical protein